MSSNEPQSGVPVKLVETVAKLAEKLPPILRYTLAIIILLILPLLLGVVIPNEIMLLIWLLAALGLVGYILFEVAVLRPRKAEPAPTSAGPESAVEAKESREEAPAPTKPIDPTAAKLDYLRRLQTQCNTLMLQYIDPESLKSLTHIAVLFERLPRSAVGIICCLPGRRV